MMPKRRRTFFPPCSQLSPFVDELVGKYPGITFAKVRGKRPIKWSGLWIKTVGDVMLNTLN